jgi:hypothetical protein
VHDAPAPVGQLASGTRTSKLRRPFAPPVRRSLSRVLLPACLALAPEPWAWAQAVPTQQANAPNLLVFEVRLGQEVLSDAVSAFQYGDDVYLPLGELSKLLTIAISTQPAEGRASGYILSEERSFSLNVLDGRASIAGREETLDRSKFKLQSDDIYVASSLLERWLPVDLHVDMSGLVLQVRPREELPLQASLARRGRGKQAGGRRAAPVDPGFPRQATPYALAGVPFIDQTLGVAARHGQPTDASYTAYLTGDVFGMQGVLYASRSRRKPEPEVRLTLGRHDPDAGLLGPLHARSALFGSVAVPGVSGISLGGPSGNGIAIGNRPLRQPDSFDRHTLEGDLPPGWDVELYANDALVGFQQSRADGKYRFEDQPLMYGPNEFRLVFHGPLGQVRVERQTFLLDQSQVAPGQLYYHAAGYRDPDGHVRAAAQFDLGLAGGLSANGGIARLPLSGLERRYANLGLRHYWKSFIVDVGAVKADDGGLLARAQLKTRIAGLSVSAGHTTLRDFSSEVFPISGDPIRARDELRVEGALAPGAGIVLPLSLQVKRDRMASDASNTEAVGRISAYRYGTAVTNAFRWQSLYGHEFADGSLQVSRRMAGFGVSGRLLYGIRPVRELSLAALALDKNLGRGYLLNLGVLHSFNNQQYDFSAALNKSLGNFGMGINAYYSTSGNYGGGIQLFVAMGREPRSATWHSDALPLANSGAASARVFLDKNLNGVMDAGDELLKGAAFTVNGGSQPGRSDAAGIAYLNRLPPNQPVDIGLDVSTLEDPQWTPRQKGVRIVPRPGKVSQIEFAVIVTGEIDGTTYLTEGGARRAISDVELELVDRDGKVAATGRSSSDGYFILPNIAPGDYQLRPAAAQLQRLGLTAKGSQRVTIGPEGTILNGRDLHVERAPRATAPSQ